MNFRKIGFNKNRNLMVFEEGIFPMVNKSLMAQHGIPVLSSLGILLVGAWVAFSLFQGHGFTAMHGVYALSGLLIGMLTPPKDKIDHRGTNGMLVLSVGWMGTLFFAPILFPDALTLGERVFGVMSNNIIDGFILIFAMFAGTLLKQYVDKQYPTLWPDLRAKAETLMKKRP